MMRGDATALPTILDIARAAGVSKSVVSRALRDGRGVAPATVVRVRRAATEMGYVANAHARGMSAHRTFTLGVVLRDAATPFYGQLMTALQSRAASHGYRVITATGAGDFDPAEEERALGTLVALRVEGLVVCSGLLPVEAILPFARHTPTVVAGRPEAAARVSAVYCDEVGGGAGIAEHIVELGHRRVAVVTVRRSSSLTQSARSAAMVRTLLGRGAQVVSLSIEDYAEDALNADAIVAAARELRVTALLAPSDRWAVAVLEAMRRVGMSAPGDWSVTGYDGLAPLSTELIGLTSWRQPIEQIARTAIDVVVERVVDPSAVVAHVALDGALVPGRTAAAPAPEPFVSLSA